jgi:hypothetical protein
VYSSSTEDTDPKKWIVHPLPPFQEFFNPEDADALAAIVPDCALRYQILGEGCIVIVISAEVSQIASVRSKLQKTTVFLQDAVDVPVEDLRYNPQRLNRPLPSKDAARVEYDTQFWQDGISYERALSFPKGMS